MVPPSSVTTNLVDPSTEPDVEKFFAEGRYDREIRENFTWNGGVSWDRNRDAGILSRTIVFGGVGNRWWDREDFRFYTTYGLSYTDRDEENIVFDTICEVRERHDSAMHGKFDCPSDNCVRWKHGDVQANGRKLRSANSACLLGHRAPIDQPARPRYKLGRC